MRLAPLAALVSILACPALARADDTSELYSCKDRSGTVQVTLKPETDLKDLVDWVMGFTCRNYMLDPRVVGTARKVTIIAPSKMTTTEAYQVFLSALSTIGLTAVKQGTVYRIVEAQTAKKESVPLMHKGLPDDSDQLVRYVVKPSFAQPDALVAALKALQSDAGDIQVAGSLLLITDYGSHVRDMMSLIALIDVPKGSDGIYTIPVLHADAPKLVEKLDGLLGITAAGAAAKDKPAAGGALPAKLMADERSNTILVVGTEAGYQRIKALVERLDIALEIEGGSQMHVFHLKSAVAEEIAQTLTRAIDSASSTKTAKQPGAATAPAAPDAAAPQLEGPVKVFADKATNALIVMSSGRDYLAVKGVIEELDVTRRQVYIEAQILEVAMDEGLEYGAAGHGGKSSSDGSSLTLGAFQTDGLSTLGLTATSSADGSGSATGASKLAQLNGLITGIIGVPLSAAQQAILGTSIPSFSVLFQALADSSRLKVLSAPSIIALDNEEAKYQVGTNIPVLRQATPSFPGSTALAQSYDRRDLVLELDIKPHISPDESILLEIKHQAQDFSGYDSKSSQPIWSTRAIETRVVARDQETFAIGGLMQERVEEKNQRIPLLGSIPVVGALFGYTTKSKRKTNLLILMTPYIVKDQRELQEIKERKMREHHEFMTSLRSLDDMVFEPHVDYRKKRGLLEEINRALQHEDEEATARAALHGPVRVESGAIDVAPATEASER